MIGKTLGRYKVLSELGRGAMGAVYRAVDPLIDREVAIKTLLPNLPPEVMAEVRERFIREARSAGRLNHPSIVTIFDVGESDGVAYIAMELLDGRSLQQMLRDPAPLPFHTSAELAAQVADALDVAQQFKIVHRDVKPANIMVGRSGRAKLTDFGVARLETSSMTQDGAALGSPKYMSPEQVLGLPIDPRSDIFSLGVVLYEMLTRRTPFERPGDSTVFTMLHRIAGEPHPPVHKVDASIPVAFDHVLSRALAKKPEQRYQHAGEMAADLRNFRNLDTSKAPQGARPAAARPGAADFDKTTLNTATVVRPPSPEEEKARAQLLSEMDRFTTNFEQEEQARVRAEQEAAVRKQAELQKWGEAEERKRQQFDNKRETASPSADTSQTLVRRTGALDALRKQAAPSAPAVSKEGKAEARAKAIQALDEGMKAAHQYLSQFVKELNSVNPTSGRSYEFIYLGKIPAVDLHDAKIEQRPSHFEGRNILEQVVVKYRVSPAEPVKASVGGEDIPRCKAYLESLQTDFKAEVQEKNWTGKILKVQYAVTGSLPCQILLRGDYSAAAVLVELVNVRRVGKVQARIPAMLLGDVVDDLARFAIGVDDDFEKVLKIGK